MKPQNAATLDLLRARGVLGITPAEAREAVGTDRLAARVWELKHDGFDIERQNWTTPTGKTVARYVLHEAPEQMSAFGPLRDAQPSAYTSVAVGHPADRQAAVAVGLMAD